MEDVRDSVYFWCLDLMKSGNEMPAVFLMLATWNFAHFRYHMKDFDLEAFKKVIGECDFSYFDGMRFETADLDNPDTQERITAIYKALSDLEGVKYVGATKIMHLYQPQFFMMWDMKIRQHYEHDTSPEGYLAFMQGMQQRYKMGEFPELEQGVSIARAIDIHNISSYTD